MVEVVDVSGAVAATGAVVVVATVVVEVVDVSGAVAATGAVVVDVEATVVDVEDVLVGGEVGVTSYRVTAKLGAPPVELLPATTIFESP